MAAILDGLTYNSAFYDLLNGALSQAGYQNAQSFFRDEFTEDTFPSTKWQDLFPASDESNDDGVVYQFYGVNTVPVMATYTSSSAEGHLISNEGFKVATQSMPQARISYRYNEKSFLDGQRLMRQSGIPEYMKIYSSFLKDTTDLIAGVHSLRSYTALQVESTGKLLTDSTNNNGGIIGLEFDFTKNISNFSGNVQKAGGFGIGDSEYTAQGKAHDWTNVNAYPIGDLRDMVWVYENYKHQDASTAVIRMSKHDANIFYNHPTTKAEVQLWRSGYVVNPSQIGNVHVDESITNEYLKSINLPTIEVEKWYGAVSAINPATKKMEKKTIQGFANGKVLLRPAGICGNYQWQAPTTIFSTSINPMYLSDGGRIGVQQETRTMSKEMYFCAESKGIAVPNNVDLWLYLDIKTSQETT